MTQANKANLSSAVKELLLVEGVDDWHILGHIAGDFRQSRPDFGIEYCSSDFDLMDMLGSVLVASNSTKRILGAVLDADADTGVERRFQAIRDRLEAAYDFPTEFPAVGLILTPKKSREDCARLPKIGVWLMPDNQQNGILEDLLCEAIPDTSRDYISAVVDTARRENFAAFRDVERSKAIVKTHVAWQDPNKKNLGEALNHFENLNAACQNFLGWLNELFS